MAEADSSGSGGIPGGLDELVGGLGEAVVEVEEGVGGPGAVPVGGKDLGGQARVGVRQAAPVVQGRDVVGEGLRGIHGGVAAIAGEHRAVPGEELVVEA